jgi:hypothetical protein
MKGVLCGGTGNGNDQWQSQLMKSMYVALLQSRRARCVGDDDFFGHSPEEIRGLTVQ